MTTKHTPGPWAVVGGSIMVEYDGGFFDLAYVDGIFPNGYLTVAERNANANLIAAAPDLLAALELMAYGHRHEHECDCYKQVRDAIAKAKGETS